MLDLQNRDGNFNLVLHTFYLLLQIDVSVLSALHFTSSQKLVIIGLNQNLV
jgi:hypothetical protein